MVVGNNDSNTVDILDVFTGMKRASYALTARPTRLLLDPATGHVHVALGGASALATVNLIDAGISYLPLPAPAGELAVGNSGRIFAALRSTPPRVAVVDTAGSTVEAVVPVQSTDLIAFNRSTSQLLTASGGGVLSRYTFDPVGLTLTQVQSIIAGNNCSHLELSPDEQHLALSCAEGNDFAYRTFDYNPTQLATNSGSWNVGMYPTGGRFSASSQLFLSSNEREKVLLFDVGSHAPVASFSTLFYGCTYAGFGRVGISRGGKVVFGLTTCGFNPDSARIYWWLRR